MRWRSLPRPGGTTSAWTARTSFCAEWSASPASSNWLRGWSTGHRSARHADGRRVEAPGGPVRLVCTGPVEWPRGDGTARAAFAVSAGDALEFRLRYSPAYGTTLTPLESAVAG